MRRLALSDEILLDIEKPARYIGGGGNFCKEEKEKRGARIYPWFPGG